MKFAVSVLSILVTTTATAQPPIRGTVQDLYQACQHDDKFCIGYIAGVFETMTVTSARTRDPVTGLCADSQVTYGAAQQAFINWAAKHPELWSKEWYLGVVLALQATWPCPSVPGN